MCGCEFLIYMSYELARMGTADEGMPQILLSILSELGNLYV